MRGQAQLLEENATQVELIALCTGDGTEEGSPNLMNQTFSLVAAAEEAQRGWTQAKADLALCVEQSETLSGTLARSTTQSDALVKQLAAVEGQRDAFQRLNEQSEQLLNRCIASLKEAHEE